MAKESIIKDPSLVIKICSNITKYAMYGLLFLLPLFFLPFTSDALDFNKQALLMVITLVALLAWIVKSLISGSVTVNNHRLNIILGALFLASLLSSLFSVFKGGSVWGWPQPAYESLVSLLCFCVAYFLVSTTFSETDVFDALLPLSASFLIAGAYGIVQLFDVHILRFAFANSIYFNTVGSVGGLGLWCAVLLPVFTLLLITVKKWWKVLYALDLAVVLVILLLVNYTYLWWLVLLASCLLMVAWILKRGMFDGKWMFLPTFFLVLSLFFIIINPQIGFLKNKPLEITLSAPANLSVDGKTLLHFPLFGSGPGTFAYDFLKNNDGSLNSTQFWNVQFNFGFSKFLTALATTGVLGIAAWLALVGYALWYGIKKIMAAKETGQTTSGLPLLLAVVLAVVVQAAGSLFFNSSIALDFMQFFFIGALAAVVFKNHATYVLKPSSLFTLVITICFTVIAIFGIGGLILEGKRYVANLDYTRALSLVAAGNIDAGQKMLEQAASLDSSDLYLRQLSQVYLLKIQSIAKTGKTPDDQTAAQLKVLVANAINSAKLATDASPNDVNNWAFRAGVYQNLIGLVADANTWALKSYDSAIALNPNNPYLLLQKGSVYYQQKDYQNAQIWFGKALALKPDYPDALYLSGLTFDALGQSAKALEAFTKLSAIVSQDPTVLAILQNLKAGKPALSGLVAPAVTQTPPPVLPPAPTPTPESSKTPPTKK